MNAKTAKNAKNAKTAKSTAPAKLNAESEVMRLQSALNAEASLAEQGKRWVEIVTPAVAATMTASEAFRAVTGSTFEDAVKSAPIPAPDLKRLRGRMDTAWSRGRKAFGIAPKATPKTAKKAEGETLTAEALTERLIQGLGHEARAAAAAAIIETLDKAGLAVVARAVSLRAEALGAVKAPARAALKPVLRPEAHA